MNNPIKRLTRVQISQQRILFEKEYRCENIEYNAGSNRYDDAGIDGRWQGWMNGVENNSLQNEVLDWPDANGLWWVKSHGKVTCLYIFGITDIELIVSYITYVKGDERVEGAQFIRATPPVFNEERP